MKIEQKLVVLDRYSPAYQAHAEHVGLVGMPVSLRKSLEVTVGQQEVVLKKDEQIGFLKAIVQEK